MRKNTNVSNNRRFKSEVHHLKRVNSVVYQIAHRKIDRIDLPQDMIIEAYQIYVDEAYHAYFCADFQSQLEATTGCKAISISPASLGKFLEIQSSYSKPIQQLLEVFFVFVSETLISGILTEIPKDKRVKTSVCQLISDRKSNFRACCRWGDFFVAHSHGLPETVFIYTLGV